MWYQSVDLSLSFICESEESAASGILSAVLKRAGRTGRRREKLSVSVFMVAGTRRKRLEARA